MSQPEHGEISLLACSLLSETFSFNWIYLAKTSRPEVAFIEMML